MEAKIIAQIEHVSELIRDQEKQLLRLQDVRLALLQLRELDATQQAFFDSVTNL